MIAKANPQRAKGVKAVLRWLASLMLLISLHALAQSTSSVTYVYTDPQGTPLAEADASGNITATFEYTPYGTFAPTGTSNPGPDPKGPGYTGHVNDPETNLVYIQARYYDPATGHFLSVDPITPTPASTLNFSRYAYANNNPIAYTDATGAAAGDIDPGCGAFNCQTTFFGNNGQNDGGSNNTSSTSNRGGTSGWQWLLLSATDALCQGGIEGACDEGPTNSRALTPGSNSDENWSIAGSIIGQAALIPLLGPEGEGENAAVTKIEFPKKLSPGSANQIKADLTMSDAIKNLSANGYSKSLSQDGKVTIMSKGTQTYTFYPKSTGGGMSGAATGIPSASLTVGGSKPVAKIRFTGP